MRSRHITLLLFALSLASFVRCAEMIAVYTDRFDAIDRLELSTRNCRASRTLTYEIAKGNGPARQVTYAFQDPKAFGFVKVTEQTKISTMPQELSVDLFGDRSNNLFIVELVDASGEQHQYKLGLINWHGWKHLQLGSLPGAQSGYYGGDGNKQIDLPVTCVTVSIRNFSPYGEARPEGTVYLDNLSILSAPGDILDTAEIDRTKIVRVSRLSSPVAVDGDLQEWGSINPILLNPSTGQTIDPYPPGTQADATAKVYLGRDDRYLYIAAEVIDDMIVTSEDDVDIWQDDGIELWLDLQNDSGTALDGDDDYRIKLSPASNARKNAAFQAWGKSGIAYLMAATKIDSRRTAKGYTLEAALPLDALIDFDKKQSGSALNLSLCDRDATSSSRLLWAGRHKDLPLTYGFLLFSGEAAPECLDELVAQREKRKHRMSRTATSADNAATYAGHPEILAVEQVTADPRQFEKFELNAEFLARYTNPFDCEDISLQAQFVAPDGKTTIVDGFYYQEYRFCFGKVTKLGDPGWKIRFCPTRTGRHTYRVTLKDATKHQAVTEWHEFTAKPARNPGFLRVSPHDRMYLAHDDGSSFYGIGYAAHEWNNKDLLMKYEVRLNHLAAFGCNYTSVNFDTIGNSGFGLCIQHLDRYSLENAWQFDFVLSRAERRGIYIIPCLFQTKLATGKLWKNNRYNKQRGGPCDTPAEFFTSPEVRRISENRLRYLLARWGYSPHILGWEIFNEVNYCDAAKSNPEAVVDFIHSMARYLRTHDPNRHLISTSFGSGTNLEVAEVWQLPEIDFTITHTYTKDIAKAIATRQADKRIYGKPTLGGECGISVPHALAAYTYDPDGLAIHNNLWASALNGAAGNILNWWHNRYQAIDVAFHYRSFANFANGIAWDREGLKPAELQARDQTATKLAGDIRIATRKTWYAPEKQPFTLNESGLWTQLPESQAGATYVADADLNIRADTLPGMLFGSEYPHLAGDIVLHVECPQNTTGSIDLGAVAVGGTRIEVRINDTDSRKVPLRDADGLNNPYADELSEPIPLQLQQGPNTITISNTGAGWVSLDGIELKGLYPQSTRRDVRVRALLGPNLKLLWLQNVRSTWYLQTLENELGEISNCQVGVPEIAKGTWRIEYWDTWEGKVLTTESSDHSGGTLDLNIPKFQHDLAIKIIRDE